MTGSMKYLILLGDGMADNPVPELGGLTPLQAARKPNLNRLASLSTLGMVRTIPPGMSPGSDVANLAVMGYDPKRYYSGRSPLEAVSMGIQMSDTDVALRCNLVTLSDEPDFASKTMLDYSAGEITTEEAREIIALVDRTFRTDQFRFYAGISYRHCLIQKNGQTGSRLTPPHDIILRPIAEYLPAGEGSQELLEMMEASYSLLKDHPVNLARRERGQNPANAIWLWGAGKRPALPAFYDLHGLRASVISAVDLIKGIGLCAGMRSIDVPGATGTLHTNFAGKAQAALRELETGQDFVYLHIEAPDECGHHADINGKVLAIERIDEQVLGILLEGLERFADYRLMILPDHPTPLALRTHTADPVPFLIYQKTRPRSSGPNAYDEAAARSTGLTVENGADLMNYFLARE